jgi:AraC-like DNA-binding protein
MKGIDKLEMFLSESGIPEVSSMVSFFRNLQALRSTGSGHRKGKKYEKVAQRFGIGSKNLQRVFEDILTEAISVLAALS